MYNGGSSSDVAQQRGPRAASGGARRYLEMRERERWGGRHHNMRRTNNGPAVDVNSRGLPANHQSEEMIRRFLENLDDTSPLPQTELGYCDSCEPSRYRLPLKTTATRSDSGQPYYPSTQQPWFEPPGTNATWMPPRDTRRELLQAADQHLKAAEDNPDYLDVFDDFCDGSELSSCYVPRAVFDFKSRAARRPRETSPAATEKLTAASQTASVVTELLQGRQRKRPQSESTILGTDSRLGRSVSEIGLPRIYLPPPPPSMHPPSFPSPPSSLAPSPTPTLDQLIRSLQSSSSTVAENSNSDPRTNGSSPKASGANNSGPNRQLFIVKRYHPLDVQNLISAPCSLFGDQCSETSV